MLESQADRRLQSPDCLTVKQLRDELQLRGLDSRGNKKAVLAARLADFLGPGVKVKLKCIEQSHQSLAHFTRYITLSYKLQISMTHFSRCFCHSSSICHSLLQLPKRPKASRMRVFEFQADDDESSGLDVDALQDVWDTLVALMGALSAHPDTPKYLNPEAFQEKARQWTKDFRNATFDEDVIPYIHCKYTEITGVNLSAFVYRLFAKDFSPIVLHHQLERNLHETVCRQCVNILLTVMVTIYVFYVLRVK